MKKHGDRQRKRIPRDGEAMCDILEFICGRLGIRLSFLEYVSEGVSMDDDGGFVDKVDACLDATNLDMDDIRQRLSDLEKFKSDVSGCMNLDGWMDSMGEQVHEISKRLEKVESAKPGRPKKVQDDT